MSNGDQAAFPSKEIYAEGHGVATGLTKREYFAGLAMLGILASDRYSDQIETFAVGHADDLLRELAKETV